MSFNATAWAWRQTHIKGMPKLVLLALADFYNDATGQCNPSLQTLADKIGVSKRSAWTNLETLKDLDEVYQRRTRGPSNYELIGYSEVADVATLESQMLPLKSGNINHSRVANPATQESQDLHSNNLYMKQEDEPKVSYGGYNGTLTTAMVQQNVAENKTRQAARRRAEKERDEQR